MSPCDSLKLHIEFHVKRPVVGGGFRILHREGMLDALSGGKGEIHIFKIRIVRPYLLVPVHEAIRQLKAFDLYRLGAVIREISRKLHYALPKHRVLRDEIRVLRGL